MKWSYLVWLRYLHCAWTHLPMQCLFWYPREEGLSWISSQEFRLCWDIPSDLCQRGSLGLACAALLGEAPHPTFQEAGAALALPALPREPMGNKNHMDHTPSCFLRHFTSAAASQITQGVSEFAPCWQLTASQDIFSHGIRMLPY